jgi:DNA-binding transcriptional LysR family regulator
MSNPKFDLSSWKLFVDVAEAGSLTKAALVLDSAQPAVSRRITALERECGAMLFHRTGRGVTLTDLGQRAYARVKALLQESEAFMDEIHDSSGVPSGEVRVGVLPSVTQYLVGTLFKRVRSAYPAVRLHLIDGSNRQLDEWLADGKLDMAILFGDAKHIDTDVHHLSEASLCLIGPKDDPLTATATIDFAQLDGIPLVLPTRPNGLRTRLDGLAKEHGIVFQVAAEVDSMQMMKDISAQGGAYSVLIRQAVSWEIQSGILQATRIENPSMSRRITAAVGSGRPSTRATKAVLRTVLDIFGGLRKEGLWPERQN